MNTTIASITARALLGRRRFLLLLPLPLLLVGLTALAHGLDPDPSEWGEPVVAGLGFAVVLPVIALVLGTGVLGAEIDDGTIVHILAKPLPRSEIILAKLAVSWLVSWLVSGVPLAIVGIIAGSGRLALGLFAGAGVGALAYSALFLVLSLLTRRPVLIGLIYIVLWEGVLGNVLTGTRALSVQQYVQTVSDKVSGSPLLTGSVSLPVSLAMAAVFVAGGTILAIDRLRSFSVAGETS